MLQSILSSSEDKCTHLASQKLESTTTMTVILFMMLILSSIVILNYDPHYRTHYHHYDHLPQYLYLFPACRALSKQRGAASTLHQRFMRHDASVQLAERPAAQRKAAAAAVRAYANVWFTCEDFASSEHTPQGLDTIMCLSVTKWVHLNQGDEGLKRLFIKVKEALVPGGWFILEPQPWKSYKQARRKQVCTAVAISAGIVS